MATVQERFWAKVRKGDGCWEWTAALDGRGYGKILVGGRRGNLRQAHRLAYELEVGPIPPGLNVCHSCDNRKCVRPSHLWLGTQSDNIRDARRKGRSLGPPPRRGPRGSRNKVSAEDVAEIRRRYAGGFATQRAMAREYRLAVGTVNSIVRGRTWS